MTIMIYTVPFFPSESDAGSACWSPDGKKIAVAIVGSNPEEHGRIELVELDGSHRTILTMPNQRITDTPEWKERIHIDRKIHVFVYGLAASFDVEEPKSCPSSLGRHLSISS
jgi:hypothetical protein